MDDRKLLEDIADGNGKAFGILAGRYAGMVKRTAFRITGNREDAEDVMQEVFLKLWKNSCRYDSRYSCSTWIYRITVNSCIDHLRKNRFFGGRAMHRDNDALPEDCLPHDMSAEDRAIVNEDWRRFLKAVKHLSSKQRCIFVLKELEGLETSDIMAITDYTKDQIKSNLYLARQAVINEIKKG